MRLVLGFIMAIMLLAAFPAVAQDDAPDCDTVLEIWQVQGSGDEANCLRSRVRLEDNIVTAVGPNGFFLQTPADRVDGDDLTSDGVYVRTGALPASWGIEAGDRVNIDRGRVEEVFGTTMISVTSQSQVEPVSKGNPLPDPIDLTTLDLSLTGDAALPLERVEGMYVVIEDATVQAATNRFDEFIVTLTGERAFREPGVEADRTPDLIGIGLPEWDLNPEVLEVDPPEMGLEVLQLTPGTVVTVTGGIAYNFSDYQLFPSEIVVTPSPFEVEPVRAKDEGEFTIATQNVENFFDTVDDPNRDDGPFENYTPVDEGEYAIRLEKLSLQVREVLGAPDVLAIQEIENARTLTDLILRVNQDDPSLRYAGCILEGNEGRGIDVAYMVRIDTINVLDCYRMPGSYTETLRGNDVLFSRPPLVIEIEIIRDGESFPITLVNAHIKSLSGIETTETQERRELQAIRMAEFVQSIFDDDPDAHVVVLGDLNAFEFTDGIVDVVGIIAGTHDPEAALRAPADDTLEPNLTNQVLNVDADDRFTFMFNGSYQVLDHILTSPGLDPYVTGAEFSRGNAEAPAAWSLDLTAGAARSADHDGFVIYIRPFAE